MPSRGKWRTIEKSFSRQEFLWKKSNQIFIYLNTLSKNYDGWIRVLIMLGSAISTASRLNGLIKMVSFERWKWKYVLFYMTVLLSLFLYHVTGFANVLDRARVSKFSLTIGIHIPDQVFQFRWGRILSQSPHDNSNLVSGDETAAIVIKEFEGLTEIWLWLKQYTKWVN